MLMYWVQGASPWIAVMYGKKNSDVSHIVGGVKGHIDHPREYYAKYQFRDHCQEEHIGTFGSVEAAKQAVEDAHRQTHPEQAEEQH